MTIMIFLLGALISAICIASGVSAGSEAFVAVGSLIAAGSGFFLFD